MKIRSILSFFLLINLYSCDLGDKMSTVIHVKNKNCNFYIKKIAWLSDQYRVYISDTPFLKDTISDPYFKSHSFFFKIDKDSCKLIFCNSDLLRRSDKAKVKIEIQDNKIIDFKNYNQFGFYYIGNYKPDDVCKNYLLEEKR